MGVSVRSALMAGIASLGAVAIAVPSAVPAPVAERHAPVALVAQVSGPPAPVTPTAPTVLTGKNKEPIAVLSAGPQGVQLVPVPQVAAAPGDITVQNAASDFITAAYQVIEPWVTYLVTDLTPWALGFIPFGWIIGDQIEIWYDALALPVANAFVYQFLNPVVNNPLNPAVWFNGLVAIGNAAVTGVINGLVDEVYWAWSLLPLPPLPPWPFAATAVAEDSEFRTMAFEESTEETTPLDEVVSDEVIPDIVIPDDVIPEEIITDEVITDDLEGDESENQDESDLTDEDLTADELTDDELTEDEVTEDQQSTETETETEQETEPDTENEPETENETGTENTDTKDNTESKDNTDTGSVD